MKAMHQKTYFRAAVTRATLDKDSKKSTVTIALPRNIEQAGEQEYCTFMKALKRVVLANYSIMARHMLERQRIVTPKTQFTPTTNRPRMSVLRKSAAGPRPTCKSQGRMRPTLDIGEEPEDDDLSQISAEYAI